MAFKANVGPNKGEDTVLKNVMQKGCSLWHDCSDPIPHCDTGYYVFVDLKNEEVLQFHVFL